VSIKINRKPWLLNGNEDINISSQFIGNIDNIALPLRTNNIERMRINESGLIGIGTSTIGAKLHISGQADEIQTLIKGFSTQTNPIFKIQDSTSADLIVINNNGEIGIRKTTPTELIDIEETRIGNAVIRLKHMTSNEDARLEIITSGGGGADPFIRFAIDGATTWSIGVDDSDSDSFKIANFTSVGTNARIKIEKGGKVFINRNLEVGSTQTQDEVQIQVLAGTAQTANIIQFGENGGGALDQFFVLDEIGRVGIGISVNPAARLDIQGSMDEIQTLIKGFSTQTSNVFEIQDSIDTKVFVVDKIGRVGIKKATPTALIDIEESITGNATIKLAHVASGLSNNVTLKLQTEGSGGGDPRVKFNIKGISDGTWTIGIDNSDLDAFKISNNSTLETNTRIKIEKDGKVFIGNDLEVQKRDVLRYAILMGS